MMDKLQLTAAAILLFASLPLHAQAVNCNNLPTQFQGNEFPNGDFFSNFNNPCYLIPIMPGSGMNGQSGDLNAVYNRIYFKVDPQYQLVVLGTFPHARYFSVTVYDAHSAISQTILDTNITPLTSQDTNPYTPGAVFVPGQQYAVPINLGGTPGTPEPGCTITGGYHVDANALDGTQRHVGMDWNWDAGIFQAMPTFPLHFVDNPEHTNPNTAGAILVRNYLDIDPSPVIPSLIVRDVATGCAYPATYAQNILQIVTETGSTGNAWLETNQIHAHNYYEGTYLPKLCFNVDPQNLLWLRGSEYAPGGDPDSSNVKTNVPLNLPVTLAAAGEVMRIRGRLPITPPTPCTTGCSRSGAEQMRYSSLSFQNNGGFTLSSVADNAFTQDPAGYYTLIVGTGASIPSWITPANGYTFLDLTTISGYQQLNSLEIRNILPAGTFRCSGEFVPFNTSAYSPAGGLMGEYLPSVDYPLASSLPPQAVPLVRPYSCDIYPNGQAGTSPTCGLTPSPPAAIQTVTTQCGGPGCNQVVAQPLPPMTITGAGFGNFPDGLPFTGNTPFLEITDTTQNWDAGHGSDICTVSISGWYYGSIQLVPNVGLNTPCPLQPGDNLTIKVWNPQSPASPAAVTTTTVGYPLSFSSASLNFGNVFAGNSATLTETITNQASMSLQVLGVSTPPGFTYTNNCTAPVSPGASCSISVTFTPTLAGVASGLLSIGNNLATPVVVPLRGTGVGVSLYLPQSAVIGGNALNSITVTQLQPASAGETIMLSSSNASVAVTPASVTIAAGAASSAPFSVTSTGVAATTRVTLTATYLGIANTADIDVNPAVLVQLNVPSPTIISGLTTNQNNVTLNGGAPPAGAVVSLSSANPAVASVPASVTIPANARSVAFAITAGYVSAPTPVVITATYGSATLTATVNVTPASLISVSLSPTTVIGGVSSASNNLVVLNGPAPPAGAVVMLSSSNPAIASVPASVTVSAGSKTSPFLITTTPVSSNTTVTLSAMYNGVTQSATLTVVPLKVYSVNLSQSMVKGGHSVAGNLVQLNGPAPTGGINIALSSSNPAVAAVPASVSVLAGNSISNLFTITTTAVAGSTSVTISATYQGSTQSATLTVTP